jgi:hypothetical protein
MQILSAVKQRYLSSEHRTKYTAATHEQHATMSVLNDFIQRLFTYLFIYLLKHRSIIFLTTEFK